MLTLTRQKNFQGIINGGFFSGVLDYAEKLLTIFALRVKTLIGMLSAD